MAQDHTELNPVQISAALHDHDTAAGRVEVQADADMAGPAANGSLERLVSQLIGSAQTVDWTGWRGNVVTTNPANESLLLACHPAGAYPLYYRSGNERTIYSNRFSDVSAAGEPDWTACIEFLLFGYTLNGRTFEQGTHRLRPGEVVELSEQEGSISSFDSSPLWRPREPENVEEVVDAVWEELRAILGAADTEDCAIMMSGGWDSRTLLGAMEPDSGCRLFSHGDPASRELEIVRWLAAEVGHEATLREIDADDFTLEALERAYARSESVMFPHWHRSGKHLSDMGVRTALTGIFGEVLGGHYGLSMAKGGFSKGIPVLRHLLGIGSRGVTVDGVRQMLTGNMTRRKPWFLTSEFWESSAWSEMIEADVDAHLGRLRSRGVEDPELLLEAFITEHRGSQYIAQQPRSFQGNVGSIDPFSEVAILERVASMGLRHRVHNSLNRRLLRKCTSKLLDVPTAAILVGAGRPIFLQEASRLLRKLRSESGAKVGIPQGRTSWINYEFLRDATFLQDVVCSLHLDVWDREAIHRHITQFQQGSGRSHALLDMLMKIWTIDKSVASASEQTPSSN